MKGFSEKIVSIGGWGAAGMMRNSFHCYKSLPTAASKAPQPPMPNQTPNPPSCQALIIYVKQILPFLIGINRNQCPQQKIKL
jgi:hypothetical protein